MDFERRLVAGIQGGIEIVRRPYEAIAAKIQDNEDRIISQVQNWLETGVIKRFGIVVRHRLLGYTHNAMVVWDIPDDRAGPIGQRMSSYPFVTLCYRRRRSLPAWPYNVFCMIHGSDRAVVLSQIAMLNREMELDPFPTSVLFSSRCFKQRGARYD